jgi:hypothetical protein
MSVQHDISPAPPTRTYLNVAALEAELSEAEREARGALGELQAVESAAPPPEQTASKLGSKLWMALGSRHDPLQLSSTIGRVRALTGEIRDALEAARVWAAEVEASRAALMEALNTDPAVQRARKALAAAHKGAAALSARLGELRAGLAKLGGAPASVEQAGAWAQQRAALQAS